ncbi:hypothetical protein GCM10009741_79640 [Kribbella lupini]|uniref:Uncharacterized protein n=1 Tax=Kribbella lupini TaxID=291602 RepID=A0ABN2CPU2_9ACTN
MLVLGVARWVSPRELVAGVADKPAGRSAVAEVAAPGKELWGLGAVGGVPVAGVWGESGTVVTAVAVGWLAVPARGVWCRGSRVAGVVGRPAGTSAVVEVAAPAEEVRGVGPGVGVRRAFVARRGRGLACVG